MLFWSSVSWLRVIYFLTGTLNGGPLSETKTARRNERALWGSVEFHMLRGKKKKRFRRQHKNTDMHSYRFTFLCQFTHDSWKITSSSQKTPLISNHFILYQFIWVPFFCAANQPQQKLCVPAYLFPFPVSDQTHNATQYDTAISKCTHLLCFWSSPSLCSRPVSLFSSLQGLLEHFHAHRCGICSSWGVHHHLRRSVCKSPLV